MTTKTHYTTQFWLMRPLVAALMLFGLFLPLESNLLAMNSKPHTRSQAEVAHYNSMNSKPHARSQAEVAHYNSMNTPQSRQHHDHDTQELDQYEIEATKVKRRSPTQYHHPGDLVQHAVNGKNGSLRKALEKIVFGDTPDEKLLDAVGRNLTSYLGLPNGAFSTSSQRIGIDQLLAAVHTSLSGASRQHLVHFIDAFELTPMSDVIQNIATGERHKSASGLERRVTPFLEQAGGLSFSSAVAEYSNPILTEDLGDNAFNTALEETILDAIDELRYRIVKHIN